MKKSPLGRVKHMPLLLSVTLIAMVVVPAPAIADGMAFDRSSFEPLKPHEQRAVLALGKGVEHMLIALDLRHKDAVWVFPVPGQPEQVIVDVSDSFVHLTGMDFVRHARTRAFAAFVITPLLAQIPFGLPLALPYYISYKRGRDVTTHMKVDKFGVHAEVITTNSPGSLNEYFREKGVSVPAKRLAPFREYLSDKYALVVCWVAPGTDDLSGMVESHRTTPDPPRTVDPCLLVRFPTEKGYYPLKATAGYGDVEIPVSLYVLGFVTVDYLPLKRSRAHPTRLQSNSYAVDYVRGSATLANWKENEAFPDMVKPPKDYAGGAFGDLSQQTVNFTRVTIRSRAALFTEDLRFSDEMPVEVKQALSYLKALDNNVLVLLLPLTVCVVSGALSGALAGLVTLNRVGLYAGLGPFVCLSYIGLAVALETYWRVKGDRYTIWRKVWFMAVYFVAYNVLVTIMGLAAYTIRPWDYF
jgi:hypothetical protein